MVFSLKDLLSDAVSRAHIGKGVMTARSIEIAHVAIVGMLPAGHQDDARVVSLREGVLSVACKNSSAAHLVATKQSEILAAVKRAVPESSAMRVLTKVVSEYRSQNVVE